MILLRLVLQLDIVSRAAGLRVAYAHAPPRLGKRLEILRAAQSPRLPLVRHSTAKTSVKYICPAVTSSATQHVSHVRRSSLLAALASRNAKHSSLQQNVTQLRFTAGPRCLLSSAPQSPTQPPATMSSDLDSFHEYLRKSKRILAVCGAGLGASSGLPTFRGAGGVCLSSCCWSRGAQRSVTEHSVDES